MSSVPAVGPGADSEPDSATPLLSIDQLCVEFATAAGWLRVTDDVSFTVAPGETVGLVGESGCGKTVTALSVMRLIPPKVGRTVGAVHFDGRDLLSIPADEMRRVRSQEISMIFQEPMTSLNPAFTIGNQIAEVVRTHQGGSKKAAWARAVEMLDRVGIADASARAGDYPHTFSGGMRQRAMIAMALSNDPKLLVADEPTTALDVTIQAQILDLLAELQRDLGMAVLFVTHDLGVVAQICERVVVMYAGQVVEEETVDALFARPLHPYTEGLLDSMPQVSAKGSAAPRDPGPGATRRRDAVRLPVPPAVQLHRRGVHDLECRARAPRRWPHAVPAGRRAHPPGRARGGAARGRGTRGGSGGDRGGRAAGRVDRASTGATAGVLVDVRGLSKAFPVHSGLLRRVTGQVRAVDGVDFTIERGETLGLVGESGSGKSTVARAWCSG